MRGFTIGKNVSRVCSLEEILKKSDYGRSTHSLFARDGGVAGFVDLGGEGDQVHPHHDADREGQTRAPRVDCFAALLTTEDVREISVEVIDDHLGFIARNADDLANLELGLMRLERAAHTPDALIDQMIDEIFSEQKIQLREVA